MAVGSPPAQAVAILDRVERRNVRLQFDLLITEILAGFLRADDVDALVAEAIALYSRIMAHDPADRSCDYLFAR